jgi:hypothetical protein
MWQFSPSMLLSHRGEVWYGLQYGDEREVDIVDPPVGLPCWLLTSKAILSKGLKQLFTRASDHNFGRNYGYQRQSPLTDLSVATNCRLTGVNLGTKPYDLGHDQHIGEWEYFHAGHRARKPFLSLTSKAKTLIVAIDFIFPKLDPNTLDPNTMTWTLDLRFLYGSGLQFDELTINFRVFSHQPRYYDTFATSLRNGIQSDIARVGELLVGKDAVSSTSTTPYKLSDTSNYFGNHEVRQPLVFEYKFSKAKK